MLLIRWISSFLECVFPPCLLLRWLPRYRNGHAKNGSGAYFCFSTRGGPTAAWSEPAPSGIPDSISNMNAGVSAPLRSLSESPAWAPCGPHACYQRTHSPAKITYSVVMLSKRGFRQHRDFNVVDRSAFTGAPRRQGVRAVKPEHAGDTGDLALERWVQLQHGFRRGIMRPSSIQRPGPPNLPTQRVQAKERQPRSVPRCPLRQPAVRGATQRLCPSVRTCGPWLGVHLHGPLPCHTMSCL